jgi:predicted ATPase/class 3 adenylate cyclase
VVPRNSWFVAELPSGTVTTLFTDVEGSTQLLQKLGTEAYREELELHRTLLRTAFERHGGHEVEMQGDSFHVAFTRASDAAAAAAEAQRALNDTHWPHDEPIRVRIGIHTGEPSAADDLYVGLDIHRAARVMAAAHGGQVLVSESTAALINKELPPELILRDLGEHRLKDLSAKERLYQLGEVDFPPLKTLHRSNLPVQPTPFLGRERELAEVIALARANRLVTLTGTGGSGKTRLALQAAAELVDEFEDGVWFVSLAALKDAELVSVTISSVVGASSDLDEFVAGKHVLLVLDNLEQLLPDVAPIVARLEASIIATSRERLNVYGEQEYPVLTLPPSDAAALFTSRARQLNPGFQPDERVTEVALRLDGLPLALELAAARVKVLTTAQILERLGNRLAILTTGSRDAEKRHRTLRATIDWSYDLLTAEEKRFFARLGVFAGSFAVDAAETVAEATLDLLASLVDKSLLRQTEAGRFFMLDTIREYALERLHDSDEDHDLKWRHARHIVELAESAEEHLRGAEQVKWFRRLEPERDNIRAALDWSLAGAEAELALRVVSALRRFWMTHGAAEGLSWVERTLERTTGRGDLRARALETAGVCAVIAGEHERGLSFYTDALAIHRASGDRAGTGRVLNRFGPPLINSGRYDEAEKLLREAVVVNRQLDEKHELSSALGCLAVIAWDRKQWQKARSLNEEALVVARELGDTSLVQGQLANLAEVAVAEGNLEAAEALAREAITLALEIGDQLALLISVVALSWTVAEEGNHARAGVLWGIAERLDYELGENMWRQRRWEYEEFLGRQPAAFVRGVEEGRSLAIDAAVEYALEKTD